MQEFLANNTVSCNLMSLTGYRTLVILNELLKSPKSIDELNEVLLKNEYIKESFSPDTLRIYINSLRKIGCEISKASKRNNNKFVLLSHPFELNILPKETNSINKILTANDSLEVNSLLKIEEFICRLCSYTKSEKTINALQKNLILKRFDKDLIQEILSHCNKKNQISMLYNSPKSGEKIIEIVCDKLIIKNRKLYLGCNDLTHNEYALFPVDRIVKIQDIKLNKNNVTFETQEVICKIFDMNYQEYDNEKILDKLNGHFLVKFSEKNEFALIQKLLYFGNKCEIVSPENFKMKFVEKLKKMEAIYAK